ncbi:MAG: biotin/lipoyl-binding protein [Burkholderiaceae bacterium]|jgi:HlyD family secretion protein
MNNKILFTIAGLGILGGITAAVIFGMHKHPLPPVFEPTKSPYPSAIYANGIVESLQSSGMNTSIFPEVTGVIANVPVHEGDQVKAGATLLSIDDTVQRATTEQLHQQAEAASALLHELKAEPRKETLDINVAQVEQAEANLQAVHDQYTKRLASYQMDARSVSKDVLDTSADADRQASAALDVARRQLALTKAGAWTYDIANQEKTYLALEASYESAKALLAKYTIKAPYDGVVLAVNTSVGNYVSAVGSFDPYTQGSDPILVLGTSQDSLAVRCYIDEILVAGLPTPDRIQAQMQIRGTEVKVPLEFVRVQPYVSPKIELSNERQEKVDLRVLPVIFRFKKTNGQPVYPGQLVDVYIGKK